MRINELIAIQHRRHLDTLLIFSEANIKAFAGVNCDNGILTPDCFYTDFRYIPMVHRLAPELKCKDIKSFALNARRIGIEFGISHARFLALQKAAPRGAKFTDITSDLVALRSVKTTAEIALIRAAERLNCAIWREAKGLFRKGMTEREMAAIIQKLMIDKGEGEAFKTIVCVGRNAAECHHEPDDTRWDGNEPVLVDMGVKLDGVCSDLTRNILPKRQSARYREVYQLVEKANRAAIAAAKPGITGRALDRVARSIIAKGGYGKYFGHGLGHGVGYEIHESPYASKKSSDVLRPGMLVTIEPGIYLEGELGVRIEDLILITPTGCEVLST